VTRVEEWTKAEIGVGAAIAIGNQLEKGNSALFVIKVNVNRLISLKDQDELKDDAENLTNKLKPHK